MIAGLEPYPKTRDSGIPWLKEIPSTWVIARNGSLFGQRNETGFPGLPVLEVSLKTGVRVRDFEGGLRKQAMSDREKYKRARKDDLTYNTMRMWQGAVGTAPVDGLVSPAYVVVRAFPGVEPRFFVNLFKTDVYMGEVDKYSHGIVKDRNRLYWEQFKQMPSPVPPPDEQEAIVRFLDHADRRIRRYIGAKQNLIKLLEEQKQAIIHRAVTRGLDPSVRFKPSGTVWLGDIPEHWSVQLLKTHIGFREGPGIMRADFRESGVPLLRIACLLSRGEPLEGCNFLDARMVEKKWAHFRIQPGDYILNASTSAATVLLRKADSAMCGAVPYTGLIRMWPCSDAVDMDYFEMLFSAPCLQRQLLAARSGVGIAHFGPSHLRKVVLALPPVDEQRRLVVCIAEQTLRLQPVIVACHREMALLREYRTRLIADVVTGKLDVREAAARLPEHIDEPDQAEDQEMPADPGDDLATDDLDPTPEEADA